MERFAVEVGRTRTASGWEWFLLVNGERVQNAARVGLFTGHGRDEPTPAEMLRRLLRAAARD
jgi:hypothetical protein